MRLILNTKVIKVLVCHGAELYGHHEAFRASSDLDYCTVYNYVNMNVDQNRPGVGHTALVNKSL